MRLRYTMLLIPQIILNDLGLKLRGVWDSLAGMLASTDWHASGIPCRFLFHGEMQKNQTNELACQNVTYAWKQSYSIARES